MTKKIQKALNVAMDLHKNHGLPMDKAAEIALVTLLEKKPKKHKKIVKQVEYNLSLLGLSESIRAG